MTITTNHTVDARHHGAVTNKTEPDPEVPERARPPRRFSADYKTRILAEYEHLSKADKGALLRREGLYSSLLTEWRRQRSEGGVEALGRLPGRQPADRRAKEIAELKREDDKLTTELAKARKVIEVQGELALLTHPWVDRSNRVSGNNRAEPYGRPRHRIMVATAAWNVTAVLEPPGARQRGGATGWDFRPWSGW